MPIRVHRSIILPLLLVWAAAPGRGVYELGALLKVTWRF